MIKLQDLKKKEKMPLSGYQLEMALNNEPNIMTYRDLIKIDNLDDILGPNRACIILYETRDNMGHYVLCFEKPNGNIEFFDSLSYFPDSELSFISKSYKIKNNLCYPYLIRLLYNSGRQIEYNDHKLQQDKSSTCGRWVIIRYLLRNIDIDDFANLFKNQKYTPDDIVSYVTYNI